MNDKAVKYIEEQISFYTSISQVLPFDDEYNTSILDGWRYVTGYESDNPVVQAMFHSEKKLVVLQFLFCPLVNLHDRIKFHADSEYDARWKLYSLMFEIMSQARTITEQNEAVNVINKRLETLRRVSVLESEEVERSEIA